MTLFKPQKIFVDKSIADLPVTTELLSRLDTSLVEYVEKREQVEKGKKTLFITKNKGTFLKPCPATPLYICCNYHILNVYNNCSLECSYCILQQYLNNPFITIHVNLDDLYREVTSFLKKQNNRIIRVGSGELADSLDLEGITHYAETLVPFFAAQENVLFELKTKTNTIDTLLDLKHNSKTVISWSINPPSLIKKEEPKTASLELRLQAALKCQQAGYLLGFHLDPVIYSPDWEENYYNLIKKLFTTIDRKRIIWISLGMLRFPPSLKPIIRERFPDSTIMTGEFFPGNDGKMRYLKAERGNVYKKIVSWIKKFDPDAFIYFCMESREIWNRVLGWRPKDSDALDHAFTERIKNFR